MQCTSYFSNPAEQALLALQVREAELRVAREELAFLQACGGVGAADVRRLRAGLGIKDQEEEGGVVVVKEESSSAVGELVSLKSVLRPLITTDSSVNQLCRRVRPALERHGVPTFKRQKVVHVLKSHKDWVLEVGRGVWDGCTKRSDESE